jgi:hypothetical protein
LATPEVMAFGKETSNPLIFKKKLLGTSNTQVWGIDECVNTHHFYRILTAKTRENTQECIKIIKISQRSCFICFKCKMIENKRKTNKVCIIGSFSPPAFKSCQN